MVSADPVGWTPHVLDGQVKAIVQTGNTVLLGGAFTQVSSADGQTVYSRSNIVAFNATTGAVSTTFVPQIDDEVTSLLVSPDGKSVFAGGFFNTVNGKASKSLAKIDLANGQLTAGFTPPAMDGRVKDLRLTAGRLWVAGHFGTIAGRTQPALATLNPTTGAYDAYQQLVFGGPRNGGVLQVMKMDVTPDGTRLVAIGNFSTVGGQPRAQIVMLDLAGSTARLANWQTDFYVPDCNPSFDSYMRDLDIAPDGSYFVVTTTGGYQNGPPKPCDTSSRWETGATGTALAPTWVDYTGGDTLYAVAVTGEAIYIGGHFRWQNNPVTTADHAGAGAVGREGIAALDPANGLPLRWNPGRTKGVGVFDLLATSQGVWAGSDTDRIGNWEYHARIAFFPLTGGTEVPQPFAGALPTDVYLVPSGPASPTPQKRRYDGTTVGATAGVPGAGVAWQNVRGGFMLGDQLYTGWSDGSFNRRVFTGTTYGTATTIDAADQLVRDAAWHSDVAATTGMFVADGKLYYTRTGANALYYRYFSVESDVVGAQRFTASGPVGGLDFSKTSGMFVAAGKLYLGSSADGNLRRITLTRGVPTGTATIVSGPGVDGHDWRSRATFLFTRDVPPPNQPPSATLSETCTGLSCDFSSVGSSDADGTIASYAWNFGDGATATGAAPRHAYTAAGTYTVRLTVTDDDGAATSTTKTVTVRAANQVPTASFTVSCNGLACTVDGRGSRDPDGTIGSYAWTFGDGTTATGATASRTYAAAGSYPIRLTVTDNAGATDPVDQRVSVAAPGTAVKYVAQAGANTNVSTHRVTIPSTVAAGDRLLLLLTINTTTPTVSAPSGVTGWAGVGARSTSGTLSRAWQKAAAPTDAGKTVNVVLSGAAKGDLTLVAYRGPNTVLRSYASVAETTSRTTHKTPTVPGVSGAWLVSYWGEESAATTAFTRPAGQTLRRNAFGTGPGHISTLLTDTAAVAGTGTKGGLTATANSASPHATMWSFLIGPGA